MSDEESLYPIRFNYLRNTYSSVLYDVDGNVLVGETGQILNVYKEELKDMLQQKKIRYLHYLQTEPTYTYFITSTEQLERFHADRQEGSPVMGKTYHVYTD